MTKGRFICCAMLGWFMLPVAAWAVQINIAAVVNEAVITSSDVADRRDFILASSAIPATVEAQARLNPRVLETLINETLQLQEAKRLSIEVSDAEVAAAIAELEASRKKAPGSLAEFIAQNHLAAQTLDQQLRAQLAWGKVVQRKLRRTVNIAEDEVTRAQVAEAAAPGITEVRIAAISLPVNSASDEKTQTEFAESLSQQLSAGAAFLPLAMDVAKAGKGQFSAPIWVAEAQLQPAMQQALRSVQPGQVTAPLRSQNSYQLIQLLDRTVSKPQPDSTEVVVRHLTFPTPKVRDQKSMQALEAAVAAVQQNPGSCMDATVAVPNSPAKLEYIRATYGQMSAPLRAEIGRLGVGELSEPMATPASVTLLMLCERIEAPVSLPDANKVRDALYTEKLELEAQKYLRNLRRDAFIEIKGGA